jgi:hypothetical protein
MYVPSDVKYPSACGFSLTDGSYPSFGATRSLVEIVCEMDSLDSYLGAEAFSSLKDGYTRLGIVVSLK